MSIYYDHPKKIPNLIATYWWIEGRGTMGAVAVYTGTGRGDQEEWQAYIGIAFCYHLSIGQDTSEMEDLEEALSLDVRHIMEWGQKLDPVLAVAIFDQLKIENNKFWREMHRDSSVGGTLEKEGESKP